MNPGFAGRKHIESALLEYHRTPGKYPLLLRRPEILFSSIKEVLQLASGRLPDAEAPASLAVQRAAGFFVRTALLYPAADHYALLGLSRNSDTPAIKERYRHMMRLMHPDFATSPAAGGNWPADAAARINLAYEVLASQKLRREYDEKINPGAAPKPRRVEPPSIVHAKAAAASPPAPDPRLLLKRMAGVFGILAALALGASLMARGPDRESLVQRATPQLAAAAQAPSTDVVGPIIPPAEIAALLESLPSLHGPIADPPQAQAAQPAAFPLQLPLAVEAPGLRPESTAPGTVRTAALAPLPPPRDHIIGVSIDARASPPMPKTPPAATLAQTDAPASASAVPAPSNDAPATTASPAAAVRPPIAPAVTMVEAHTLLSALLQQMEAGSGDRLLSALDRTARNASGAQALARQYNSLVDGARSVKVANVLLKADPREDRLLVRGQVLLEISDSSAMRSKELSLEAEFAKRNGAVVMTRLAPAQSTAAAPQ